LQKNREIRSLTAGIRVAPPTTSTAYISSLLRSAHTLTATLSLWLSCWLHKHILTHTHLQHTDIQTHTFRDTHTHLLNQTQIQTSFTQTFINNAAGCTCDLLITFKTI